VTRQTPTRFASRVVVLGGDQLTSLRDWMAEVDRAVPQGDEGAVGALLLDFRSRTFAPSAEEAGALVERLRARLRRKGVALAVVAKAGAQFGGARVFCTLAEMQGCRASVFVAEAEAWLWLRAQLAEPAAAVPPVERPSSEAGAA
jgi:hypothetical protein